MNRLVDIALGYEGFPAQRYRGPNTGQTPDGFDCSGYVQWVLLQSGICVPNVPHTEEAIRHSEEFFDFFGFLVDEQFRQPGDLVFFSKTGCRPSHVGIHIGEGKMIHSPGRNDSQVSVCSIDDFCNSKPLKFRPNNGYPQIYQKNPIGYKRVALPHRTRYQMLFS